MPSRIDDVMQLLSHVAEEKGIKVAMKSYLRAVLATSLTAGLGAGAAGPPGFIAGGLLGMCIGLKIAGELKSVRQILKEFTAADRQKLYTEVMAIVKELDWNDASELIFLVMANSNVKNKVIGVLTTYLKNELKAQIKYGK